MWPALGARVLHASASNGGGHAAKPLVLLCGWLGSHPAHLDKYAQIYEEYGAECATMRPTLGQTALPSLGGRAAVGFVRSLSDSLRGTEGPIFVQCMSNAGWIAFGTILHLSSLAAAARGEPGAPPLPPYIRSATDLRALATFRAASERIAGVVIDSAPSLATPHIWARGVVAAVLEEPAAGVDARHPRLMRTAYSAAQKYMALPQIARRFKDVSSS